MSCGLAHEMVACFYNFCVMEKKAKNLTTYGYNFQYGCVLTVANMTSQVTCLSTLYHSQTRHHVIKENNSQFNAQKFTYLDIRLLFEYLLFNPLYAGNP